MPGNEGVSFYERLGITPDADPDAIRAAYRDRVKETHPDVSDAADATREFQRVKRAHEVLTDPVERRRYDRLGHETYVSRSASGGGTATTDDRATGGRAETDESTGSRTDPGANGTGWGASRAADPRQRAGAGTADPRQRAGAGTADGGRQAEGEPSTGAGGPRTWTRARSRGPATLSPRWIVARWVRFAAAVLSAWQVRLTPAAGAITLGVFVAYPVLLMSSVAPWFPAPVNVFVGGCTLLLVGYLVLRPVVGVPVFGGWTLLFPVALTLSGVGLVSLTGLFVVALTVVPLAVCLGLVAAGMPV